MTEYDMIKAFSAKFPRSSQQLNKPFECDSELIRIGDQTWALTIDDFSPEEDLFTMENPETLGANLAVATLSDLLAAGADPQFFMHAVSVPANISETFLHALSDGIRETLEQAKCHLIGGDLGQSATWRYCGFAMGPVTAAGPLTRRLTAAPGTLWVTGRLGDANLAALTGAPTPRFELRTLETPLIRQHATACMDTSGGLMDALWTMHQLSPDVRINLHTETIPLADGVRQAAQAVGIPPEAALTAGAGEYELLFATGRDIPDSVREEFANLAITPVADLSMDAEPGIHIYRYGNSINRMDAPPPCPRSTGSRQNYINAVAEFTANLF